MALNESMLAQLIKHYTTLELAQVQVPVSALVTSTDEGAVTVATVDGPLTMSDDQLTALANAFAKAVVLHLQTMGQADPVTGKII